MWLIIVFALIYFIYKYVYIPLLFWDKKNVPHESPIPIFGNVFGFVTGKESNIEINDRIYKMYPNDM